ncbi:MAG TPA: NAD(P)/FAD-dependent oxidoreductase, partial [Ardenticatenaceae bacterium]|nr:NAD(P)/FAD-dependent oxidoreductase [Ardenticatenaceae bacterium]
MLNINGDRTDVVVGGGLAGLTAACYLARGGRAVTLLEKSATVGGRASTQTREGFAFNRGIHALYCGGAGEEVLKELEVPYSGGRPRRSFVLHQGKLSVAPADPVTLLTTDLLGPGDKLALLRLLMSVPRMATSDVGHVSVQEWLEQHVQRPRVRAFVAALARTFVYSAALDLVSAEVFVRKLQTISRHPVLYLDGGWQTLIHGLCTVAERAGARIVTGASVEAVEHAGGRVQGVRLRDGSRIRSESVVLAMTPAQALRLVDTGAYPALRQIVDSIVPVPVACLDVALRRLPVPRFPIVQDVDKPRFMSTQSLYSRIAPEGGALIHTFKQLDPTRPGDPHQDERDLEELLDTVQPGWRDVLVKRVYLPRIEAVGMLPTAAGGGFAGRPGPEVAGLPGLYLVGDWIGPEGFLSDASFASARAVAQLILETQHTPALPVQRVRHVSAV